MVLRAWLRPRNWGAPLKHVKRVAAPHSVEILGAALFVSGCILVAAMFSKEKHKATPKEAASTAQVAQNNAPVFTVDMALAAVVRATSADNVCYDSVQNAYYMHWTRAKRLDNEKESVWSAKRSGWYMMGDVPFLLSANGTWFIRNADSIPDSPAAVDVTNLPCMKGKGKRLE